jgi:tetratricopeptide (TPR) repeat protein
VGKRTVKPYRILALLAVFCVAACTATAPKPDQPMVVITSKAPNPFALADQLAEAMNLVKREDWPKAQAALQAIIEDTAFSGLSSDTQYHVLWTAGRVFADHGQLERGYEYLVRAAAMPQSNFDDLLAQMRIAAKQGNKAETVSSLTSFAQRYPEKISNLNTKWIVVVARQARQLPAGQRLALYRSLYAAHWKLQWNFEPSYVWVELTRLLLEHGEQEAAVDVSTHVTDAYDLIVMRVDRRFDMIVAAHPAQFDIDAAAARQLKELLSASEKAPRSLELKETVIETLRRQQRYAESLAAVDALVADLKSTNSPDKAYEDYERTNPWILDERGSALARVGRWDDAVVQLTAASILSEDNAGNISQIINLAQLYCELSRPKEALKTLGRLEAKPSPYGVMQVEYVKLDAATQLRDKNQIALSLNYLEDHRADAPNTYEGAQILVNDPDRAARFLIERLQDVDQRAAALLSAQSYGSWHETPRMLKFDAHWRAILARADVQEAIQRVGRVESFHLEEQPQ